ncbi:MAG: ABC transporter substrate-binding protein, partial [Acidimicrobiales bacterium]
MRTHTRAGRSLIRRTLAVLIVAAFVAAACGNDDSGNDGGTSGNDDGTSGNDDGTSGNDDGTSGGDDSASGSSIVIAIADEPSTLDPQIAEDGNERAITDNIYETLLWRDTETNELEPFLAAELPTQVDDTTWEFVLREDVTFTNGEPFNAESVAYSVNRLVDPDFGSAQRDFYGPINGAEAVDEFTVHITTDGFDPVVPARMYRMKMLPAGADDTDYGQEAIGTGPYKLVEWERGQEVTLELNEDYWGETPSITDVTFRFIPSSGTRVAGLGTGEIHLSTLLPPEQAADAPQVLSRDGIEFPVYRLMNYDGLIEDPRIRQAMNYAVDKEAIADDLYSGFATVAQCQVLTEGHFGYN